MRKFIFSLKSLAMTLALVVGGSAWAQIASLPFVADFSSGEVAPFTGGSAAFVATTYEESAKVIAANNGESYAQFATSYAIGNMEEVTVSFQMLNGWLQSGASNKFSILNSEGVALASISYNNGSCNITEVLIDNSMVDDFVAFNGQSSTGSRGANGYATNNKQQHFKLNTSEKKYNPEVTIKINSFGGISVSIVGGNNNNDVTYSRAAQPGTKLDLDKVVISNASNNGDRATGYYGLKIESKSMIKYSNDYSNGVVTWTTATSGRFTPIIQDGYLTVTQNERNNNGTTITSTETEGKVAAGESFTMSFDVKLGASTNQTATAFNIYDAANSAAILSFAEGATYATAWTINGGTQTATVSAGGNKAIDELSWISVKVTSIAGGKTYLTLKDAEGTIIDGFDKKDIPTLSETGGLGKMNFVTSRYLANFAIDNIVVREVVESEDIPATPIYTYTVKFVDQDGNEFKDASVREEYEGTVIAITEDDKATVVNGKSQYTYVSNDAAADLVAAADGSTVITVTFEKTTVADYVVNYLDGDGNVLKEATTHKNAKVGSQVNATLGEVSRMLINGVFYDQVSGNEPLTVSEDETANVINLVFAPVDGVTGYFYNNYENKAIDWKTSTGGRFDPIVVDGSTIADRATTEKKPVLDPETGETIGYEEVPGLSIPFANKTLFLAANQNTRDQNGATLTSNALNIEQADFTFEARLILGTPERDKCAFNVRNLANDADIFTITPAAANATNTDWVINGDAENFTISLPNTGNYSKKEGDATLTNYSWYNFKVTVYNGTTFVTVTDEAGNAILDKAQVPTLATTYGISNMTFPTGRYHGNFAIDDVTVRSVVESEDVPAGAEFVAVKINYVDDAGAPVKPAGEAKFQVGKQIVLNSAFTADFKVDAEGNVWTAESESAPVTKYIYVSDNSADVEVALDAQVNIVFRGVAPRRVALRPQYQTVEGEMKTKDASGKNLSFFYDSNKTGDYLFEKDILTVYYPYYLLVDGLLYKTGNNSGGTDKIELEIEPGTGTQAKSPVTWTPATETVPVLDEDGNPLVDPETEQPITRDEQISNAVFAQETENIEGITPVKDTYTKIRMANGATGSAIGGDVLVTTLEPGTYTITTATRSGTTNFKAAGNVVATITSGGTVATVTSEEFTVDQATPLYIEEQASTTQYSDYVLVRKTKALESYKIAVAEGIVGGTIEVASSAAADAEITITATPDEDYELSSISVTCAHKDLAVIVTDGKFTMPDDDVTVNATFRKVIYIETDLTKDFEALTDWKKWTGAQKYTDTQYCPAVTTNAGQKVQVCEKYETTCANTGDVFYQTVTGLTPGVYKIELYGGAAFTFGRGFGSMAFTGEIGTGDAWGTHVSDTYQAGDKIEPTVENPTGVSLQATTSEGIYGGEIPIYYATNFPDGAAVVTIDGVQIGSNGEVKIGMSKTSQSTNWHVIQLKGVTAKVLASDLLATAVAKAKNVAESDVPAKLYGEIQEAITTYDKDYETADDYQAAIDALNALVAKAEGYSPLAAVLNEGAQYKANAPEEDPAIATYDQAIADVKAAYDEAVVADIPAAVAVVEAALPAIAKAQTAPNSDMTRAIVNPTINGVSGWTCERPKGGGGPELPAGGAFEFWAGGADPRSEGSFDYYQVIEGLTPGKYVVSAEMYNSTNGEDGAVFAATSGVYASSGNDETATLVDVDGTTLTRYATEEVIVMDGTLRLGVKNTELPMAARWFVADNFTLTLVEHIVPTYAVNIAEGIENGTVTADPTTAAAGETVTITVTPAEGYELASISVTGVTSNIAVETQYDSWSGTAEFEMPADAVTVNATFQEAYVEVSDFAIASTGIFDEDGTVKVTGTFTPETAGSYTEMFFGDVIYDITVVPTAGGDAVQYTLNIPNDKTLADGVVSGYIPHLVPATNYTVYVDSVHVWDYLSYQEIFVVKAAEGEHLTSTTFTAMPQTELADLNVERYVGQGYTATTAEVDFSAAKTFLGVDEITSDMLYIINPDFSQIKDYAKYDGWFDGDGKAEIWGDKTKINVKFFEALTDGKYTICDMNGADVVDNTYTVRWALVNNFKAYVYTINVKFVEQPVIYLADYTQEGETVDVNIYANTGNVTFDGADSEAFQESAVSTLIGEDWEDVYGVGAKVDNQETMTDNYSCDPAPGFWCLADGTADQWANGTFGVSLIWDDSFSTFNFRAWTKGDISDVLSTTFYLVNNNTKKYVAYRVILNTVPTGIDATPAADGVKPDGKYLENGKIVIYRNGNKYDASGAPMNK